MLLAFMHGLNYGVRRTGWTLAGLSFGLLLLLLTALLGVEILTQRFTWALTLIKLLGACYLVYLGVQSWRQAGRDALLLNAGTTLDGKPSMHAWQMFRLGMGVSLSNPKAILFFAAFFPKFIDFDAPLLPQYVVLIVGFFISETFWQLVYTIGGVRLARWLATDQRLAWLNRSCGAIFVLIALGLLWEVLGA